MGTTERLDPIIGLAAVIAGLALLPDTLSRVNLMSVLQLWPIFLVGVGLAILLDGGRRHAR